MPTSLSDLRQLLGRRAAIAAGVAMLVLVAVAASPHLLGTQVEDAFARLADADPAWLWLAALCFVGSLVGSAGAWRSALGLCGARLGLSDACSRYGVGSLVNSFAPARLGDAVRIALFSRSLDHRDRLWSTGGAFAAIGAARSVVLALMVAVGAATGALPLWPVLICAGAVAAAATTAVFAQRLRFHGHVAHLLDAFRTLGRDPRAGARIVGWILFATASRLGAATAIAAAVGVHAPLTAAIIIVPALDLAGLVPLTPGNVGVTSGAVAMALQAHGLSLTQGLSTGIALHAVETAVGVLFGLGSLAGFAPPARRWPVVVAGATGCLLVAAAFSATVLVNVV